MGAGTGITWTDAYTDLQPALLNAASANTLWVAKGTFFPGVLETDTFLMKTGVDLFGGFIGGVNGETMLSQRPDPPIGTILSGDIDGFPGTTATDCWHVVTFPPGSNDIRLDGFAIRHGFADGGGADSNGGGILMDGDQGFIFEVAQRHSVFFERLKQKFTGNTTGLRSRDSIAF